MKKFEPLATGAVDRVDADKIMADLRMLAADTEALLRATASQGGQQVAAVRARADESLLAAKARIGEMQHIAVARTRAAGRATDAYVHANPWQMIAIGVAAGVLVGALLMRSDTPDA